MTASTRPSKEELQPAPRRCARGLAVAGSHGGPIAVGASTDLHQSRRTCGARPRVGCSAASRRCVCAAKRGCHWYHCSSARVLLERGKVLRPRTARDIASAVVGPADEVDERRADPLVQAALEDELPRLGCQRSEHLRGEVVGQGLVAAHAQGHVGGAGLLAAARTPSARPPATRPSRDGWCRPCRARGRVQPLAPPRRSPGGEGELVMGEIGQPVLQPKTLQPQGRHDAAGDGDAHVGGAHRSRWSMMVVEGRARRGAGGRRGPAGADPRCRKRLEEPSTGEGLDARERPAAAPGSPSGIDPRQSAAREQVARRDAPGPSASSTVSHTVAPRSCWPARGRRQQGRLAVARHTGEHDDGPPVEQRSSRGRSMTPLDGVGGVIRSLSWCNHRPAPPSAGRESSPRVDAAMAPPLDTIPREP